MLNLRETIQAALDPKRKPSSYAELEHWFKQNPRKCGNCQLRRAGCPKSYIDVGRMVRVFPQADNDPCPKYQPTADWLENDQKLVMAKLAHNFNNK